MVQMIMVMVLVACEYKRLRDGFLFIVVISTIILMMVVMFVMVVA